ncbi:RDD family protein [Agrilutibacter solisilvae]|uniref:RDD family protein n=1 Tax=Agrilutibacter solisilvae TaxID=2763317 RepID=A0A974Y1R6_9GAMM|nr:RDD family protein [Lysobacter solisilvae]QSX78810.1 RDD family protein [Lysobacter solisilvae]
MTQWYYSDYERNRHGPVSAADLAELHRGGQLADDTLVWHEGQLQWRPWRELKAQALAEAEGRTLPVQDSAPLSAGVNPYAMAEPLTQAPAATDETGAPGVAAQRRPVATGSAAVDPYSPYSPPRAPLEANAVVRGGEVVLAGFLKRLAAATIDSLVIFIVFMVMALVAVGVGIGAAAGAESMMDPTAFGVGFFALAYGIPLLVQFAYFTLMHASTSQATLGKMAVGIKVVGADGGRISLARSLGRFGGRMLFALVSCGVAEVISAFTSGLSERKQGLHDMVASTEVVDRWAYSAHPERQQRELGTVTVVVLALLGLFVIGYVGLVVIAAIFGALAGG